MQKVEKVAVSATKLLIPIAAKMAIIAIVVVPSAVASIAREATTAGGSWRCV